MMTPENMNAAMSMMGGAGGMGGMGALGGLGGMGGFGGGFPGAAAQQPPASTTGT